MAQDWLRPALRHQAQSLMMHLDGIIWFMFSASAAVPIKHSCTLEYSHSCCAAPAVCARSPQHGLVSCLSSLGCVHHMNLWQTLRLSRPDMLMQAQAGKEVKGAKKRSSTTSSGTATKKPRTSTKVRVSLDLSSPKSLLHTACASCFAHAVRVKPRPKASSHLHDICVVEVHLR